MRRVVLRMRLTGIAIAMAMVLSGAIAGAAENLNPDDLAELVVNDRERDYYPIIDLPLPAGLLHDVAYYTLNQIPAP